jgi:Amt family ammonium transporter
MAFQMMFAIITPALITGAFAERKRFKAMVVFSLLWATLVYAPVAHWVWGVGGWLREYGALDFAGGTVVHITAGIAALVAAMMLGKRIGFGSRSLEPHNLTYTVLGAGLLWFGWFGFNGGSALGANGLAASALVVTNTAAAMGGLAWMTASWLRHGHPSVLGLAAGAVAGLVAITPAAGFVNTPSAILIGLGAGVLCFYAVDVLKRTIGVDDALDVFAVHGVGGIWGALATGLFASTAVNPAGSNGLFYGNPEQLLKQAVAVGVVILFTAAVTWVILKVIDATIGLRVPEQEEVLGLDTTTHGEVAYQL